MLLSDEPAPSSDVRDPDPPPTAVATPPPKPAKPPTPPPAPTAEPALLKLRDIDLEAIREGVAAEGYRVISERVVQDTQAGTKTVEFQIEKDPVNHGIVYLTTCRDAVQARRLAGKRAVVDDNVILLIVVKAADDAEERLRKRLGRGAETGNAPTLKPTSAPDPTMSPSVAPPAPSAPPG
jgi:hypothetical protein